MNIVDALGEFIMDCRAAGRSQHTIKAYRSHVGQFAVGCPVPLDRISREDVRDYLTRLRSRPAYQDAPQKPEQSEGLSQHTIAAHDRHLRSFFAWCVDNGYLEINPMQGMKQPRVPRLSPKAVTPRQFASLLQAARGYPDPIQAVRNTALIAVLGDSGARISELLSLTTDSLDLENKRAWVLSKGSEREIFITYFTAQLVRQWMDVRDSLDKHIFTSMTNGSRLTVSGVYQMLQRLKSAAGVRGKVSAHRFRHGFAVEFVKAGGDVSVLASLLGHGSIQTTAQFYAVFSGDELKKLHDQVNPLFQLMRG